MSPKLLSGLGDCTRYTVLRDTTQLVMEENLSESVLEPQGHEYASVGLESLSEECNCSHSQQFCFEGTCLQPDSASERGQGVAEREPDELKWRTAGGGVTSGDGSSFSGSVRPPSASSPVSVCVCVSECVCVYICMSVCVCVYMYECVHVCGVCVL